MQDIESTLYEINYPLDEDEMKRSLLVNVSESTILLNTTVPTQISSKLPIISYEVSDWGPKRDSLYVVIPITLLYVAIFITGLLGNICTCVVIARNKCMHTATNYYLFSLAISDLLLLISGLPTEIYSTWSKYPYIFGEIFCILQGFAAETSANATVLTITAFTIERYVAICYPFLSHTMSKLSRAIKYIIVIWLLAMCFALPQAMAFGIFYEQYPNGHSATNDHYVCTVKRVVIPHAFEISTFVFFIAPMTVITILYVLIGIRIRKSTSSRNRDGSVKLKHYKNKPFLQTSNKSMRVMVGSNIDNIQIMYEDTGRKNYSRNSQASKHVVEMLVAVVVGFFICWAPFHAQRLLAIYGQPDSSNMITTFNILTYVSGVFYYLSTTINPLLYHIMSRKFRIAFKETIRRVLRKNSGTEREKCYSALSGRSSQVNSQSNTDSCSQPSSIRYLETEMRRLHESHRPLVVSFRRKPAVQKIKQVTVLDAELQKALDSLTRKPQVNTERSNLKITRGVFRKNNDKCYKTKLHPLKPDFEFMEFHSISSPQFTKNGILKENWHSYTSTEAYVFQEETMQLGNMKRSYVNLNRNEHNEDVPKPFPKSRTMPDIEKGASECICKRICKEKCIKGELSMYKNY
ncbi:hypothetical protein RI129_000597 [Pyrocoelia pectoralis]|uniref:G-protein coupled receptors family 1 profile domain-containing protein n=1 Tax=Pyrocoelia pectoralis TaxID=417401 RepID=A0AAN7ZW64_9COLE